MTMSPFSLWSFLHWTLILVATRLRYMFLLDLRSTHTPLTMLELDGMSKLNPALSESWYHAPADHSVMIARHVRLLTIRAPSPSRNLTEQESSTMHALYCDTITSHAKAPQYTSQYTLHPAQSLLCPATCLHACGGTLRKGNISTE